MSLVLDASVTLSWCFDDERTEHSLAVLDMISESHAWTPSLWRYEIANGMVIAQRRQRIDETYRDGFFAKLSALDIRRDEEADAHIWSETTVLASTHKLSIYDAAYLELARRRRLPLATMDRDLAKAAMREDVKILGME